MRALPLLLAAAIGLAACARAPQTRLDPGDPPVVYEERALIPAGPAVPILGFLLVAMLVTDGGDTE